MLILFVKYGDFSAVDTYRERYWLFPKYIHEDA